MNEPTWFGATRLKADASHYYQKWKCNWNLDGCEGEYLASKNEVRRGYRPSCGCLRRSKLKDKRKPKVDYTDMEIGDLYVVRNLGTVNANGCYEYECLCRKCKQYVTVDAQCLKRRIEGKYYGDCGMCQKSVSTKMMHIGRYL